MRQPVAEVPEMMRQGLDLAYGKDGAVPGLRLCNLSGLNFGAKRIERTTRTADDDDLAKAVVHTRRPARPDALRRMPRRGAAERKGP